MVAITRLRPSETVDVDCSTVAALFQLHGARRAEDLLMNQVADLTDRIGLLDGAVEADGLSTTLLESVVELDALSDLAACMGLISLANALGAAQRAARMGNLSALPALWDRVKRIGDQSLVLLWDIPQLRM